ncbi:MAG: hypothetical protein IJO17_07320 [Alistipes sp.]|nr:hypothetical protein [Alistipes sp.]
MSGFVLMLDCEQAPSTNKTKLALQAIRCPNQLLTCGLGYLGRLFPHQTAFDCGTSSVMTHCVRHSNPLGITNESLKGSPLSGFVLMLDCEQAPSTNKTKLALQAIRCPYLLRTIYIHLARCTHDTIQKANIVILFEIYKF